MGYSKFQIASIQQGDISTINSLKSLYDQALNYGHDNRVQDLDDPLLIFGVSLFQCFESREEEIMLLSSVYENQFEKVSNSLWRG